MLFRSTRLSTNYANLCARVFAPSDSTARTLLERQVRVPVSVVPTGVSLADFDRGDGAALRAAMEIPSRATVLGHVGRLAAEKNLEFLARAMAQSLRAMPTAFALIVGEGPVRDAMQSIFAAAGVAARVRFCGTLQGLLLTCAYKAMDEFVFASRSETQGLVLLEAMAAGVPVVALDAAGARELVADGVNGRLIHGESEEDLSAAMVELANLPAGPRALLRARARKTAEVLSLERAADRALLSYESLLENPARDETEGDEAWYRTVRLMRAEWDLAVAAMGAASQAVLGPIEAK